MRASANREEAAIARTPKASDETKKPRRAPAKPKAAAKPAVKAKAKAPAKAPAKVPAKPRPAAKTAARPPAKPKAAAKPAAKAAPKPKAPAAPRPTRAKRAPRQKVELAQLDRLVNAARKSLEDDKAENIVVLDVTGRADYADRLVIATGLADRQIQAMANHLEDAFEKEGLKLRRDAIQASPDWVLIDCGDLVVHLFKPEARALYALERMWGPDSPAAQDRASVLPDDGGGSTASESDDE